MRRRLCSLIGIILTKFSPASACLSWFRGFVRGDEGLPRSTPALPRSCCQDFLTRWVSQSLGSEELWLLLINNPLLLLIHRRVFIRVDSRCFLRPTRSLSSYYSNCSGHHLKTPYISCSGWLGGIFIDNNRWTGPLSSYGSTASRGWHYRAIGRPRYWTMWWHWMDRHGLVIQPWRENVPRSRRNRREVTGFGGWSIFGPAQEYRPSDLGRGRRGCWRYSLIHQDLWHFTTFNMYYHNQGIVVRKVHGVQVIGWKIEIK